jgi:hypothetical protein
MPWSSEIWVSPVRVPWCGVTYVPQVTHVPQVTQHLRRDVELCTSERSAGIAGGGAAPRPMMGPHPYPAASESLTAIWLITTCGHRPSSGARHSRTGRCGCGWANIGCGERIQTNTNDGRRVLTMARGRPRLLHVCVLTFDRWVKWGACREKALLRKCGTRRYCCGSFRARS